MAVQIKSAALEKMAKALGYVGGSQTAELTDNVVDQTIEISPIVRRSLTLAGSEGIFALDMQNVHAGAGSLFTSMDPFNQATNVNPPWPAQVGPNFDVWLLGAGCVQVSGTGTIQAMLNGPTPVQAMGEDDSGAAINPMNQTLALWDSLMDFSTLLGFQIAFLAGIHGAYTPINLRLPRSASTELTFISTASALTTFRVQVLMGLFPVSLGQDGAF